MIQRLHPLSAYAEPSDREAAPALFLLADQARFSLRIAPRHLAKASEVFGLALPEKIGALAALEGRMALCVGPDEWSLLAPLDEQARIEQGFSQLSTSLAHSLVDIGHREIGIGIEGSKATFLLQAAIAFEVESMSAMSGCRTLIGKSQILLLRESAQRFRIEVWNSFAEYVWALLHRIRHEMELGL